MAFLKEQEPICGKNATAYVIIEGRVEELFYAKSIEAKIEKNKADVPILGRTSIGKKTTGWTGSGTLTLYYMTSKFRQLTLDYIRTGRDFYFDLQVTIEDPTSDIGKQTVILKNCNLDSVSAAAFDITSDDPLEEEMPFTFSGYDVLDGFVV